LKDLAQRPIPLKKTRLGLPEMFNQSVRYHFLTVDNPSFDFTPSLSFVEDDTIGSKSGEISGISNPDFGGGVFDATDAMES
jgi:hypothetical protein